ncbi:PqqD family protein [Patulibacter sp. SYSU D01012]|uniref:PqqD family protein n=1 Tax=Patulibacter sp. SYSU D01012 TaxID=2817381 RepID=UPI001B315505|nr:PqqD family protein [Patulibacter sp. SYSU D01012]
MTDRPLKLREGQAAWREVEGEIVGVALARGEYFAVTPSGALLWQALADGTTRDALASRLVERFGIDAGVAARDVDAFVASLDRWDLLEP